MAFDYEERNSVITLIIIGGIGISGATSSQDEECAMAAINSVKELLK